MIQSILLGTASVITGYVGIYHIGKCWTRYEMNKIIDDPNQPEEIKFKAREVIHNYNLRPREINEKSD
tara:strand:- start:4802 stop:5005 length:204 start_codon:yes stop_codon:yes gene_type:complete